jgi:hypothetical protein
MPSSSPTYDCGFVSQFEKLFGSSRQAFESIQDPGCGAKPKLSAWKLLTSLAYHVLNDAGPFSAHVFELFHLDIKDGSLSERRQRMGLEPFAWLMKHALKPLADQGVHNGCFYKGLRLCGIDGSSWSVTNTPQVLKDMSKAVSRRMKAAFAKVQMCALVELGLHNPIAAVVGLKGEGEWRLAEELLECLPEKCLLIVDRLYGCGKYLNKLVNSCKATQSELLVKARRSNKSLNVRRLSDGSAMVSINVPKEKGAGPTGKKKTQIRIREIRARIKKPGASSFSQIRLWTTLLDEKLYPARELIDLYALRWEHEIYYKELKLHLSGGDVLQSHTPETAAQEVAALLMASSVIAEQRSEAARSGDLQPLSISFLKTLNKMSSLWVICVNLTTERRVRRGSVEPAFPGWHIWRADGVH